MLRAKGRGQILVHGIVSGAEVSTVSFNLAWPGSVSAVITRIFLTKTQNNGKSSTLSAWHDELRSLWLLNLKCFSCSATCRRPIRGAAGRPVASSDLWSDSLFSPKATKTSISSYTQSYSVNRVSSLPPKTTSSSLPPAVFPAGQIQAAQRSMSLWIKLFLLAIVATFLFLIYQAMETTSINPFQTSDMEVAAGSTA